MVREPEQLKPFSVLRASVQESAANTYTEAAIATPVSGAYFQAMRIHKIVFDPADTDYAVEDTTVALTVQLSTRTLTGIGSMATDGMIAIHKQVTRWMSSAAGGESQFVKAGDGFKPATWDFGLQGLLVTDSELRLGIVGQSQGTAKSSAIVIYYTLETLEPEEYIAALSVLGSQL